MGASNQAYIKLSKQVNRLVLIKSFILFQVIQQA